MQNELLKTCARDFIALGSIPFFILVLARTAILNNPAYISQLLIGGFLVILFSLVFRSSMYAGLSVVIGIFLSLYYGDMLFVIIAGIAYVLLIGSLLYLGREKRSVFLGVLFGLLSTVISYITTSYFFK